MSQKSDISSLIAARYPTRTADGHTIARSEPPGVAVLQNDGTVILRSNDKPPRSSFEEFMTITPPSLAPITCIVCDMPIIAQQPSDGPVPHGEGMAHESCNNTFTDNLLTEHPPRGHRPRSRGRR